MSRKARYLALDVRLDKNPTGRTLTRGQFLTILLESLDEGAVSGDYPLPRGMRVTVAWTNKPAGPWKSGPWEQVQEDSAETSGWDQAMRNYLHDKLHETRKGVEERRERQLERLERQYRDRDAELRRQNERGELSDIRATIERATLRRDYEARRRELRGSDA